MTFKLMNNVFFTLEFGYYSAFFYYGISILSASTYLTQYFELSKIHNIFIILIGALFLKESMKIREAFDNITHEEEKE